ncbi:DUF6528 family protein [Paenibacillus sp. HJGM_3]|uniref:DUF6528 family protein n=1 Tax=Paenibacillus sp. HJGM_3 TaxID=3379816 RepID=UPI00385E0CAE
MTETVGLRGTVAGEYLIAATDQATHRILVMDPAVEDWNEERAVVWSWAPTAANGFGELLSSWGLPTDAKVRRNRVWGGEWLIVTDSRGLAAITPYPAGDAKKWGLHVGGNPHSAELLPDGNLAVAASTGGWVRVYASSQGESCAAYAEYAMSGAHELVWDADRSLLWAVGDEELVALRVAGTAAAPSLEVARAVALPTSHGHDLQPVEGDPDRLWVSSGTQVYQFEVSTGAFDTFYAGAAAISRVGVKTVGSQPSGQVVVTVPKPGGPYEWTTDTVDMYEPRATRSREGAGFYKARLLRRAYMGAAREGRVEPAAWRVGTSFPLDAQKDMHRELELAHAAGIACIELAWRQSTFDMLDPACERLCESVVQHARALGLEVWTMHLPYGTEWDVSQLDPDGREAALQRHRHLLQLAERWAIRTVVLHPSWEPIEDAERAARLAACRESLPRLADDAERAGIRVAVECLPRTCLGHSADEMAALVAADERLGICCDVNHLVRERPEAFIRRLGARIITVHMSDNDGLDERHWLPGDGVIDWPAVMDALADAGYPGPFLFEARQIAPLMACWQRLLQQYEGQGRL